ILLFDVCHDCVPLLVTVTEFVPAVIAEKSIRPRMVPALLMAMLPPVPLMARSEFCNAALADDELTLPVAAIFNVVRLPESVVMSITRVDAELPRPFTELLILIVLVPALPELLILMPLVDPVTASFVVTLILPPDVVTAMPMLPPFAVTVPPVLVRSVAAPVGGGRGIPPPLPTPTLPMTAALVVTLVAPVVELACMPVPAEPVTVPVVMTVTVSVASVPLVLARIPPRRPEIVVPAASRTTAPPAPAPP